jgi:putative membrane protein
MGILVTWVVTTLSLFVASRLLDGMKLKGGVVSHFFVAALFGVLHVVLGRAIYLAIGIGTLGLGFLLSFVTRLVATAIILKLVDALTSRLSVKNFKTAFLAALIMSVTASIAEIVFR